MSRLHGRTSDLMDGRCRYWCLAPSVLRWCSNLECIFSQNAALTTKWLNEKLTVSHCMLGKLKLRWLCTNPGLDSSSVCLDVVQVCPSENREWEWTEIKAVTLRGIMRSRGVASPDLLQSRPAAETLPEKRFRTLYCNTSVLLLLFLDHYRASVKLLIVLVFYHWCDDV